MPNPTMRAAVVRQFHAPLEIEERPIPSPGPGQILIKTEACGVCHTDLHAADGDWPVKPALPFIPGHEGVGRVVGCGPCVRLFREGDRAGLVWLYRACGDCEWCQTGWETLCPAAQFGGYTANGGYADYMVADARFAAHIPDSVSPLAAAPLLCAGLTTYKGLKETEARAGEWVAIVGAGGLGHLAIQYARAMGLRPIAIDIHDRQLALARELGAELTINSVREDSVHTVLRETGGAHGVLVTAPSLPAFRLAVAMTRRRGTCVLVGLPPGEFPLPIFDLVLKRITLRGSLVGTRADLREALELAARAQIQSHAEPEPLEAVNSVFQRLREGAIAGRVVLDMAAPAPRPVVTPLLGAGLPKPNSSPRSRT